MNVHRPFYVVAIVGLRHAIPPRARGILERSALSPVQFQYPDEALRSLTERVQVDAILLDGACMEDEGDQAVVDDLLALAAAPPWHGRIPVIVLTSKDTPRSLRRLARAGRVHAIGRSQLGYRRVSRLVATLCLDRGQRSGWPGPAGPPPRI
jgi:hypothetical protein